MKAFMDEGGGGSAPEASGPSLTGLFAKLRAKYPELADEPLLDQAEAAASGEPEPAEDQDAALDMEDPMPEAATSEEAGDDSVPFGADAGGGDTEAPAPKGKKRKLKAPQMPKAFGPEGFDDEAADASAPVNAAY